MHLCNSQSIQLVMNSIISNDRELQMNMYAILGHQKKPDTIGDRTETGKKSIKLSGHKVCENTAIIIFICL